MSPRSPLLLIGCGLLVTTGCSATLPGSPASTTPTEPTMTIRDFGGQEKAAKLPRALTTEGVPAGADPEVGDIGYYAPDNVLVLYNTDVGFYDGIIRLGRINPTDMSFL